MALDTGLSVLERPVDWLKAGEEPHSNFLPLNLGGLMGEVIQASHTDESCYGESVMDSWASF